MSEKVDPVAVARRFVALGDSTGLKDNTESVHCGAGDVLAMARAVLAAARVIEIHKRVRVVAGEMTDALDALAAALDGRGSSVAVVAASDYDRDTAALRAERDRERDLCNSMHAAIDDVKADRDALAAQVKAMQETTTYKLNNYDKLAARIAAVRAARDRIASSPYMSMAEITQTIDRALADEETRIERRKGDRRGGAK